MPAPALGFADWLKSFRTYLTLNAGPATGIAAIYADTKAAAMGLAASESLLGFDSTVAGWPDPVPLPEQAQVGGGEKAAFAMRLKKAFPALGTRPAMRIIADGTNGAGFVMRHYSGERASTLRTGSLLRDALEHGPGEIITGTTPGAWRWAVLSADLSEAPDGEQSHFLIVGMSEQYCSSVEAWATAQDLAIDAILPAPLALLRWARERLPTVAMVANLRASSFRCIVVNGLLRYFEVLRNPYEGWDDFQHAADEAGIAGGFEAGAVPFVHWGGGEPAKGNVTVLREHALQRVGGGALSTKSEPGQPLQSPPPEYYLLAWASLTHRIY